MREERRKEIEKAKGEKKERKDIEREEGKKKTDVLPLIFDFLTVGTHRTKN